MRRRLRLRPAVLGAGARAAPAPSVPAAEEPPEPPRPAPWSSSSSGWAWLEAAPLPPRPRRGCCACRRWRCTCDIPWCVRKCPYCDFNSHAAGPELPEEAYVHALLADLDLDLPAAHGRELTSIFFGGVHPQPVLRARPRPPAAGSEPPPGLRRRHRDHPGSQPRHLRAGRASRTTAASASASASPIGVRRASRPSSSRRWGASTTASKRWARRRDGPRGRLRQLQPRPDAPACPGRMSRARWPTCARPSPWGCAPVLLPADPGAQHALRANPPKCPRTTSSGTCRKPARRCSPPKPASASTRPPPTPATDAARGTTSTTGASATSSASAPAPTPSSALPTGASAAPGRPACQGLPRPGQALPGGERVLEAAELPFEFMMNALRLTEGVPAALFEQRTGLPLAGIEAACAAARAAGLLELLHPQRRAPRRAASCSSTTCCSTSSTSLATAPTRSPHEYRPGAVRHPVALVSRAPRRDRPGPGRRAAGAVRAGLQRLAAAPGRQPALPGLALPCCSCCSAPSAMDC